MHRTRSAPSVRRVTVSLGRCFRGTDVNPEAVRLTADRLATFGDGRVPAGLPEPEPGLLALTDTL